MIDNLLKQGTWTRTLIFALSGLFATLMIFQAGVYIGYRKAKFSYGMGDKYYRVFGASEGPFGQRGMTVHGAAGKILSVDAPLFIVQGPDSIEKTVRILPDTEIRRFRSAASTTDLTQGTFVVIIGEPNENAEVGAKLIRILPPPPPRE